MEEDFIDIVTAIRENAYDIPYRDEPTSQSRVWECTDQEDVASVLASIATAARGGLPDHVTIQVVFKTNLGWEVWLSAEELD